MYKLGLVGFGPSATVTVDAVGLSIIEIGRNVMCDTRRFV